MKRDEWIDSIIMDTAKKTYEKSMCEQELLLAKFILDNPSARMENVKIKHQKTSCGGFEVSIDYNE